MRGLALVIQFLAQSRGNFGMDVAGRDRSVVALVETHREAQLPQIAIPFMGLPGLTVSTGLVGRIPVGVQVVSGRYREDLCLAAGEAIEAGGTPSAVIDPG